MANVDSRICAYCHQSLIYIKFSNYYRLVCDNDSCVLFRERQGCVPRDDNEPKEKPKGLLSSYILNPSHKVCNDRCMEKYHYARSLNIPSRVANKLRGKSRKEMVQYKRGWRSGIIIAPEKVEVQYGKFNGNSRMGEGNV